MHEKIKPPRINIVKTTPAMTIAAVPVRM